MFRGDTSVHAPTNGASDGTLGRYRCEWLPRWLPPLPLPRNIKLQWIIRLIERRHDIKCHSCINFVFNDHDSLDHDFKYYVNQCRGNYNHNYNYNNYGGTADNN